MKAILNYALQLKFLFCIITLFLIKKPLVSAFNEVLLEIVAFVSSNAEKILIPEMLTYTS